MLEARQGTCASSTALPAVGFCSSVIQLSLTAGVAIRLQVVGDAGTSYVLVANKL
jgi:hypothetical protein